MFMLVERSVADERARARFWIDPTVETALTAQINEHFPAPADQERPEAAPESSEAASELMERYNGGDHG